MRVAAARDTCRMPQATKCAVVVVMMRSGYAVASVILLLSPSFFGQAPGQPPPEGGV